MAPSPEYAKDEKVLCFHHELLYEAKVLDSKPTDATDKKSEFQYRVHYKGWKNTWDDWVPQDRLRKWSDENQELARNLKKEMEALRNRSKQTPTSTKKRTDGSSRQSEERNPSASIVTAPRGQKRNRDVDIEKEEHFFAKPAVRIVVPDRLKSLLVDDWENVTKNLQVAQIPSKTPVGIILDEYYRGEQPKRRKGSAEEEILLEVVEGVKEYFNKCLGRILLYRFEREQYYNMYKEAESPTGPLAGKLMSDVYGGEHLLRLFVSMPEMIAQTNMDQQSVNRLREELSKITMWLSKDANIARYFSTEYENPGTEYIDQARGSS